MLTPVKKCDLARLLCSLLLSIALVACGGSGNSFNSSNSGRNGFTTGSNSGSSGGTSTGGTTGSSGNGQSDGWTGPTYVYAGIYTDSGGIAGFQQSSTGALTPVTGSPYIQQGSASMPALAAVNGYVYTAHIPGTPGEFGHRTQLVYYRADPGTGSLTEAGTSDAGVGTNGDSGVRKLVVNSARNVVYGVFQYTIATYSLSSTGRPSFISSTSPSMDSVWGFDFMPNGPYAYAAIQNGNPKQGFQQPEIHLLTMAADGTVTDSRSVVTVPNASGMAGDLKIDPSGKYVVVSSGMSNEQLSVYAIQGDGSLSEVPGSPFSTGAQQLHSMAFDSEGKFLYTVNQHEEQPQAESVQVFSFDSSTGKLAPLQNLDQPDEQIATWLKVDGNYVYLTNVTTGTQSTITVFNRDPNTGKLTQAAINTVDEAIGQTETLH